MDQCIAFHLGQELTYDKVLDVLGAVDTEVFSRLLRNILDRNVLSCVKLLEEIVMQGRELTQFVTDFTWYLRNLMLAQVSDSNLEDVIDMSTDNLNRLKEEAAMVEMEQIVRYIHIFSELAGQIRYASQKRILVEIALIKLCKPEMETNQEAVLDRLRQVEEKLENGVVMAAPGENQVSGGNIPQKEKPKLERAVPEDIREIVSKWPAIVGNMDNPMKIYLKEAGLSLGNENQLIIVVQDGISSDYFSQHPDNKAKLVEIIEDFAGKEIEVQLQTVKEQREFQENFVDLSQIVRMEIEEEEEE